MCSGTPAPTRRSWARYPSRVVTAQAANFPPLPPFLIGIECNWKHEASDAAFIVWGREVFDRLQPYATGGQYVNFPGHYEDNDAMVRGAFGQNLGRLTAIKKQYCRPDQPPPAEPQHRARPVGELPGGA
jgi:hypothetical protein